MMDAKHLPSLTSADRVRARSAILTAEYVSSFWQEACAETDRLNRQDNGQKNTRRDDRDYFLQLGKTSFEVFPVIDFAVPRALVPLHILAMAELAMRSKIDDDAGFLRQAGQWWNTYTSPIGDQREFSIKWAAQEALYEALLWESHPRDQNADYNIDAADLNEYAYNQTQAPAGFAMLAYSGIFDQDHKTVDVEKRREFWLWWLTWAIPMADKLESES